MIKKIIITIILTSFFNSAHSKCDAGVLICASETTTIITISGFYYILGKNSAEAAGTFQLLSFALPLSKSSDITAEQYSLLALSLYNFSELSKYNTDDYNNIKAAEFNAVAMAILGLYSSYRENERNTTTDEYDFNIKLTPTNVFQVTLKYNF